MGTSIMAVAFDGGVVMGADSRTTTGSYVANRVSDKITPITPRVYCCRSGSAADTQIISDYVRYYTAMHAVELGSEPLVGTAARLFRQICYQNKANLMAGIIVGGYDEREGGQVYTIPLGGAMVRQPFSIGGSGSSYIYGYCDANFKDGMSRDECIDFVTKGLALACARDGSSVRNDHPAAYLSMSSLFPFALCDCSDMLTIHFSCGMSVFFCTGWRYSPCYNRQAWRRAQVYLRQGDSYFLARMIVRCGDRRIL
jgi:20S proteasome subunit beta 1